MSNRKNLVLLIGFIVFAWACTFIIYFTLPEWDKRGQVGDMFGAVNALFSGLAFAGLFYTIILQRKEFSIQQDQLILQRQELQLQRVEMKESRKELANQAQAQNALFLATVAQIKVAALQAEIEALKILDGKGFEKDLSAREIRKQSNLIKKISTELMDANHS